MEYEGHEQKKAGEPLYTIMPLGTGQEEGRQSTALFTQLLPKVT